MCAAFVPGRYACVCCEQVLFDSGQKFDSSSGWPSFDQPLAANAISYFADESHGMQRIEVKCNVCDAHLGHVFPDGKTETGLPCSKSLMRQSSAKAHGISGWPCQQDRVLARRNALCQL
ncbi:hypothetical protein Lal_00011153 [Lupinus albus]|nr:hypothetical protein Lal_00011153 [Lupinus albus]